MPRIFGMEPEQYKPLLLVGGGALVLFFVLRSRSGGDQSPVAEAPPFGDTNPAGVSAPSAGAEMAYSPIDQIQTQRAQQQADYEKAQYDLSLKAQQFQLDVFGAQSQLQTTQLDKLNRAVKSHPLSCPHGSEPRVGPDGQLYCRGSKGAVTFGNVISDPVANTIKQGIPQIINGWLASQGVPGMKKPSATSTGYTV